jgi:hypothetical protein
MSFERGDQRMTEQPRRLCCTCFRQYAPPGTYKCPDCDPSSAVPNATATKRQGPKLNISRGLSDDLSGHSLEDFL